MSNLSHNVFKRLETAVLCFSDWSNNLMGRNGFEKRAKKRVASIGGGYNGSRKEYKEKILNYWKKYGIKPKKYWYDMYCSGMDAYDHRFIPDSVWRYDILLHFNDWKMFYAYDEKGIYNRLFPDARKAETIVKNVSGYYYDGDGDHIISFDEAVRLCESEDHLIIKPSMAKQGKGIVFYDRGENSTIDLRKTFESFGKNFVAQRVLKQHPDMARLNESSLNTIRVITFHFKDEVHVLSALVRIGGKGARVDNVSAGGSAVPVKPDGWLCEKSVTRESVWVDHTENGIPYKDVRVPNFEGVIAECKRLHCMLPYFDIVGWDFAVGEDEMPVLIEYNLNPGQNQISCGPTFGDLTDEVLEEVFIKKNFKK